MAPRPLRVFYSYAHEDADLRDSLEASLATLRNGEQIEEWKDRCILPGASWGEEIDEALDRADIILLLLSNDFLNSTYIRDVEVARAMERHRRQEAVVVPIVLRAIPLADTEFGTLQALPRDGKPIASWDDLDEALLDVFNGLNTIVTSRREVLPEASFEPEPAPQAAGANAARNFEDLAVQITMDQVAFNVDGTPYSGTPDFGPQTLVRLADLRDGDPDAYGDALFDAVFGADERVAEGYERARARIRQRTRFRLRLYIDPAADLLQLLWWEALRDQKPPPRRLATQHGTPLSRFFDGADLEPVRRTRVKLLVVVSDPAGLGPPEWAGLEDYDAAAELATVQTALSSLDDRVDLHVHDEAASPVRINASLRSGQIDVLHLVAPGVDQDGAPGQLVLETEAGGPEALPADVVGPIVDNVETLRLVVLSTGYTSAGSSPDAHLSIAAQLLDYGVPAVLAMHGKIEAETAEIFTQTFYDTLLRSAHSNGFVDVAANRAREQVWFHRRDAWDWAAPVVFLGSERRIYDAEPAEAADVNLAAIQPGTVAAPPVVREVIPAQPSAVPAPNSTPQRMLEAFHMLTAKYVLTGDEIDRLAWSLGVALEDNGADRNARARELISAADRAGQLETLIGQITILVSQRRGQDPALRALDSLTA
jgi:hypothetical protein